MLVEHQQGKNPAGNLIFGSNVQEGSGLKMMILE